jgi:hypothetical protein
MNITYSKYLLAKFMLNILEMSKEMSALEQAEIFRKNMIIRQYFKIG